MTFGCPFLSEVPNAIDPCMETGLGCGIDAHSRFLEVGDEIVLHGALRDCTLCSVALERVQLVIGFDQGLEQCVWLLPSEKSELRLQLEEQMDVSGLGAGAGRCAGNARSEVM